MTASMIFKTSHSDLLHAMIIDASNFELDLLNDSSKLLYNKISCLGL